jgi:5-formyltetrahydrofolate cyclo-ligase
LASNEVSNKLHNRGVQASASDARQTLRKAFRDARLALSSKQQQQAAIQLLELYKQHDFLENANNIALYLPFNGEIDTLPLIHYLWSKNRNVFVPILHPFCKGHLLFQQFSPNTQMRTNHFGIAEPTLDLRYVCPIEQLDLLFTPLVAFDLQGNRLGMGGGFYDRTLANLQNTRNKIETRVIGLAHEIQLAPTLPIETWDIPLPYILTSNKLYSFV